MRAPRVRQPSCTAGLLAVPMMVDVERLLLQPDLGGDICRVVDGRISTYV